MRYAEAASRNNAWVHFMRNRALAMPDVVDSAAAAVKRTVVQDLTEIAAQSWKTNHGGNEPQRAKTASSLKDRLLWKTWEEVQ